MKQQTFLTQLWLILRTLCKKKKCIIAITNEEDREVRDNRKE
jgi:hypothetical protein